MSRSILIASGIALLLIAGLVLQFVGSSPFAMATIGTEKAPQTALHLLAGRQLYPLRLSAKVSPGYQGEAQLQLIGNLPAEVILLNIGPLLHPLETRSYTLDKSQILNLKAGEQVDLLVLLRSTVAETSNDTDLLATLPDCCQLPDEKTADGSRSPLQPALVLFDPVKLQKLWTIPLHLDLQDSQT